MRAAASDDKSMAAIFTDSLIRYRQEGYTPRRDIKLALTCGEETAGAGLFDSVRWLVQTRPEVLAAEFAINEGAGGEYDKDGRPIVLQVQAGEKVYQDFTLEVTDPGGHSSLPKPGNAIVRLCAGLARLGAHQFPIGLNPVTRAYFETMAKLAEPAVAADMRAVLETPPDAAAATRLWASESAVECDAAHDLHRQRDRGRPCAERDPAARAGDRQLPHPAGHAGRRRAGRDRAGGRRRRDPDLAERRGRRAVTDTAADGDDPGARTAGGREDLARRHARADRCSPVTPTGST